MFINRENEFAELQKRYYSDKFEFIVIYGRRRVGKTDLVLKSIRDIDHCVYFLAMEQDEKLNIFQFKNAISQQLDKSNVYNLIDDWEVIFEFIVNQTLSKIVVIDEFPYLINSNPSIKSMFQRIIDLHLQKTNITLILMGSSITMMENEVLGVKSPLYGRRTCQMKIHPLRLHHLGYFFPNYDFEELIMIYGAIGGIPYYLKQLDNNKSFWENVLLHLLDNYAVLYAEGEFLLKQEFTQVSTYTSILQLISIGNTKINEIKNKLSVTGDISSYLKNLQKIDLIHRKTPIFEDRIKSRKGRYYIKDNYLRFWFKYIFSYQADIISGKKKLILENIKKDYPRFMGLVFEEIVKELLENLIYTNNSIFPFQLEKLEKWWYKDIEIDLIGYADNKYLFIEIKWQTIKKIDVLRIFKKLETKVTRTKFKGQHYYLIIAKSINTSELKLSTNQFILDLSDLEKFSQM